MRSKTRLVLWLFVVIGALSALWVAGRRWQVEVANQGVEIVLDWDEVRSLADQTGTPMADLLTRFYEAGTRGIAVNEETIGEMQTLRRLEILPPIVSPASSATAAVPVEMVTRLRVPDPGLRGRIFNTLRNKWDVTAAPEGDTITIPAAWTDVGSLAIGFPPDVLAFIRARHMEPVPRVSNYLGADPETISWTADRLEAAGGRLIIFGGDQVLGYPDGVKQTAQAFQARSLLYGQVEFGKQKGEDTLAQALKGNIIRVHSISPTEMTRMTTNDAVDRFLRAAEERNIRALYVRLLPGAPERPVSTNVGYIDDIARALTHRGWLLTTLGGQLRMDFAKPFIPYESSVIARCLVGLGVGAATLLMFTYLWPLAGLSLLTVLALAALDVVLPVLGIGRKLVALQGALLMPVLAFLILRAAMERRYGHSVDAVPSDEAGDSLLRAIINRETIGLFLATTLVSALGALFVVGLLSSRMATVKLLEFKGIKAQQAGPLVMVAAIYYLDVAARGGLAHARARVKRRLQDIWNQPMLLGTLVMALVALVVLALLIARSGNDSGVGVSGAELRVRALLDWALGVRPRTKEFLIGHPALFIGIALVYLRRVRWALPLLIIGAIGQVGIVNTFCHLHTPLAVSLLHSVNGLWTGFLVAVVLAWIVDRLSRRRAADVG